MLEALKALRKEDAAAAGIPKGYIIAKSERGRFRRVHYGGACFRVPGEHYLDWEELGEREPEPHEYNARCRHCFPLDKLAEREKEGGPGGSWVLR